MEKIHKSRMKTKQERGGLAKEDKGERIEREESNGYYVAYKPIIRLCILFLFIKINFRKKFICRSCVMFTIKFISISND